VIDLITFSDRFPWSMETVLQLAQALARWQRPFYTKSYFLVMVCSEPPDMTLAHIHVYTVSSFEWVGFSFLAAMLFIIVYFVRGFVIGRTSGGGGVNNMQWLLSLYLVAQWKWGGSLVKVVDQNFAPIFHFFLFFNVHP